MSLINCPECNKEVSDKAEVCVHCGFGIKSYIKNLKVISPQKADKTNETEKVNVTFDKKKKVKIISVSVLIILLFTIIWQITIFFNVTNLYEREKYSEAESVAQNLLFKSALGDLERKIDLLSKIENQYITAQEYKYKGNEFSEILYPNVTLNSICLYIANIEEIEALSILDEATELVKISAQELANNGYDVKEMLQERLIDEKEDFEPLITSNQDRTELIINSINNFISEEEAAEADIARNPLEIINDEIKYSSSGDYVHFYGTLNNRSDNDYYFVKIRVTYLDENKNTLTSDWGYAVASEGIRAGENQQFDFMTEVKGSIHYYRFEITDYDK